MIPVETPPGEVAQVDFGYVGKLWDPEARRVRKAWVFVMVLGWSRNFYAEIVFDQTIDTWLRVHVAAFECFGGVPKTIVPDNLKAAVVRAAFGVDEAAVLGRSYRELARHFGFRIDPAPIYSPEKKGKVENAIGYMKSNFFAARGEADASVLQAELTRWVNEIAGRRTHGTTRRQPLEAFLATERAALLPLPAKPWSPCTWREVRVRARRSSTIQRTPTRGSRSSSRTNLRMPWSRSRCSTSPCSSRARPMSKARGASWRISPAPR